MPADWNRERILALGSAFTECRILLSAAELDLFTKLSERPQTAEGIAEREGWSTRGVRILLDALTAMELLTKSSASEYRPVESAARFLAGTSNESVLPLVRHRAAMWRSWSHLTHIVQTGENPSVMKLEERPEGDLEAFIGAMHVIGRTMAEQIAASLDLSGHHRLLDVGGGSGSYVMAFLNKAPHLSATLFDLPPVIEMARRRLTDAGLIDRVRLVPGDYTEEELPGGHDLVLLSAIIHSLSRESNQDLYGKVYRCLEPGGTILIRDHVMNEALTSPPDGAVFAVNMLAATTGGRCFSFEEIKLDLEAAGFTAVRLLRDGTAMDQLVVAVK